MHSFSTLFLQARSKEAERPGEKNPGNELRVENKLNSNARNSHWKRALGNFIPKLSPYRKNYFHTHGDSIIIRLLMRSSLSRHGRVRAENLMKIVIMIQLINPPPPSAICKCPKHPKKTVISSSEGKVSGRDKFTVVTRWIIVPLTACRAMAGYYLGWASAWVASQKLPCTYVHLTSMCVVNLECHWIKSKNPEMQLKKSRRTPKTAPQRRN